ncbi:hypothetical protein LCI18_013897 [Fusarium solani-melongenae]|uniref:Uncharacterized protein n=1 Tax=Fusarium solani subsp. cucurbitae TaxID=2747967 RepID=A0ACD3ZP38_FUSSC|nr:hypothetical protein LCI18_013897 [Fusarium solani-melongenae]
MWIQKDSVLIDLGYGDIRKLTPLLEELDCSQKPVLYCPLDLSRKSIERAIEQTKLSLLPNISVTSLRGTFEDGVHWANRNCNNRPKIFLSLGSMLGNDHFEDAVAGLKWLRSTGLRNQDDRILLTMDGTKDVEKICKSYDDAEGLFTQMIRQGHTRNPTMHRFVLQAKHTIQGPVRDMKLRQGDEINCYEGFKYGPEEIARQFRAAGIKEYAR